MTRAPGPDRSRIRTGLTVRDGPQSRRVRGSAMKAAWPGIRRAPEPPWPVSAGTFCRDYPKA